MRPLLLVDVDGVLNRFGDPGPGDDVFTADLEPTHAGRAGTFTVCLGAAVAGLLRELEAEFEMAWATTWEHLAPRHLAPRLGVGAGWPVAEVRLPFRDRGTWKLESIRAYADGHPGRPLAWLDDDLWEDAFGWAERRTAEGAPTLLVRTHPSDGVTREDADELLGFARVHGEESVVQ